MESSIVRGEHSEATVVLKNVIVQGIASKCSPKPPAKDNLIRMKYDFLKRSHQIQAMYEAPP